MRTVLFVSNDLLRLARAAVRAELSGVACLSALCAGPGRIRTGCAAVAAELTGIARLSAFCAGPAGRRRLLLLLLTHAVERRGIGSARALRRVHAGKRHKCAVLVLRRVLHRLRLRACEHSRRQGRIFQRSRLLELLDAVFVFRRSGNRADAERGDLDAAQFFPVGRELGVECIRNLFCMPGQRAVAKTHFADSSKCGLQRGQELALELTVELISSEIEFDIAAHVFIEQNRIDKLVGIFAVAANRDVDIETDIFVDNTEWDGGWRAVFVAEDLFRVKEVYALILCRVSAERETAADDLEPP